MNVPTVQRGMPLHFAAAAKKKLVIAGNGLGGVAAGKELERLLQGKNNPFEITILGRSEDYTFKPLLPDLVNGTPATVAMKDIFKPSSPVQFKKAEITGVSTNPAAKAVKTTTGDVPYDTLVLSLG